MNRADLQQVLGALPQAALSVDAEARILAANAGAEAIFGGDLAGKPLVMVARQPAVMAAVEAGARQSVRIARQEQGVDQHLILTIAPIRVEGAGAQMLFFEDITEREVAAQMRRDFVANVSHELRTPLTALMGFVETLQGPAKNDPVAQERFLAIMAGEAGRMNRLVQDLLSLGQVEATERIRPTAEIDLAQLVGSTLRGLEPVAESAKVVFETEGIDRAVLVRADSDQLRQVLTNLVENAIKYGGSGGRVRVMVGEIARDAGLRGPAVQVVVQDFGQGIDPVHIPRLTERFYRVDSHRLRAMGGTGLGLAIVKHIVNRHRGRFRIESAVGAGSRFSVTLPR